MFFEESEECSESAFLAAFKLEIGLQYNVSYETLYCKKGKIAGFVYGAYIINRLKNVSRETLQRMDKFHMKHFKGCFWVKIDRRNVIFCEKIW